MKEDVNYDIEKKVHSSIQRIESLHSERAFKIVSDGLLISNSIASITKAKSHGFKCRIFLEKIHPLSLKDDEVLGVDDIILESSGKKYTIPNKAAKSITVTLSEPQVYTLKINSFFDGTTECYNNRQFRVLIPIDFDPDLSYIDCKSLKIGDTVYFGGIICLKFDNKNFHLFKYKNDDAKSKYLIIDSLEQSNLYDFKEDVNAIITAFGFITGNLLLGEYYYHTLDNKEDWQIDNIYYQFINEQIVTNQNILDPLDFSQYLKAIKQENRLVEVGSQMNSNTFSKLCETIRKNTVYERCCKLIIEALQSKHSLLKGGMYSIGLETITGIIYEENKKKINPISDKKLTIVIQNKLKTCIDEYEEFLDDYGKGILLSKINDINKPTNSKKLLKPFEIYGINLSDEQIKILNHRNKFLHGTTPINETELNERQLELHIIISTLRLMLITLMLKYVGYRGHIINFPECIRYNNKQERKEHLFRII